MDNRAPSPLASGHNWLRAIYMLFFLFCLYFARLFIVIFACLQFLFVIIRGSDNLRLRSYGKGLSSYVYQISLFVTFNSEEKPYPFSDWPCDSDGEKAARDEQGGDSLKV